MMACPCCPIYLAINLGSLRYPTARPQDRCERTCCSSLCRIEGNLAVVGNEYMVSKHRGGRAPPTRFRVAGGKGIR